MAQNSSYLDLVTRVRGAKNMFGLDADADSCVDAGSPKRIGFTTESIPNELLGLYSDARREFGESISKCTWVMGMNYYYQAERCLDSAGNHLVQPPPFPNGFYTNVLLFGLPIEIDYNLERAEIRLRKQDVIAIGGFISCRYCSSRIDNTQSNCTQCGAPLGASVV